MARQALRDGSIASVIDAQQRVMGRSRNPERWIGTRVSHPGLLSLAQAGGSGFVSTRTLDGVASLTYLSPRGAHGWATVLALPQATLNEAARQLAWRAVAVSTLLLGLALGLALLAARLISRPVKALEAAAGELLAQRVPAPLRTGLAEIDRVGAVLHDAGTRSREWEEVLEARVQRAIEETRRAETSLFEARKHEAIGRLTGGVAHDFNNLLQTISMGVQMVHRALPEGKHTRPLQAALAACGRAAELVRQMLAFSRAQQLRPQPVKLADLLLRSQELTDKALGERIQFVAELDPAMPAVMADPVQLELALLNLVFNARDAMPEGGQVSLSARLAEPLAEPHASGVGPGPFVRIDVQDTGHGMDAETLSRVFEPYFTTKPVGAGTGLGLPQVMAFARQSGGEVRIDSTPGTGTCVTLLLPGAPTGEAVQATVASAQVSCDTERQPLRVLMVEDDVLVASVVVAALEHEGHHVTLCRTADECRGRLEDGIEADVLFSDIVMPGSMTGLELVDWCRKARPELPALIATGYSARTPSGAWRLLRKPYTIEDLLDALERCAAGEQTAGNIG